jgi:WS/DGAT/MGAT family acyltransferase
MTVTTAALQPLSGLDALFLQLESPEMPMHVGSLSLLELPPGYRGDFSREVRKLIGARLHLADAFRRRLVGMPLGLANPAWLRTTNIDLDHHIRRVTLPRPGTLAQLEACVGRLHAQLLDRARPLWELVVIDGLGGALKGHVGYYAKVHHAAIDGQAGVALVQAILDPTPEPRAVPPAPAEQAADEPNVVQRLQLAARQTARQMRTLAGLVPAATQLIGASLSSSSAPVATPASAAPRRERTPLLGPRTPLNVSISAQRAFTTASLPLADVKHTARALGVSLNDIVLATCSGALRRWLAVHGGVPRKPLAAGVPFSVRAGADTSASNKVSMMRAGLATHLADPAARLSQIRASMNFGKSVTGRLRTLVPTDYPSLGSAWLVSGIAWLAGALGGRLPAGTHLPSLAPVAISNVPGPPMTLYVAGARVIHYWPASIVVHGVALNITVQSYAQWLDIGLTACRHAVRDLPTFKRHLAVSFAELQALAVAAQGDALPIGKADSTPRSLSKAVRLQSDRAARRPAAGRAASAPRKATTRPATVQPAHGKSARPSAREPARAAKLARSIAVQASPRAANRTAKVAKVARSSVSPATTGAARRR